MLTSRADHLAPGSFPPRRRAFADIGRRVRSMAARERGCGGVTLLDSVILTLNAGSSSLKFAAFGLAKQSEPNLLASGQIEGIGATAKGSVKTESGETSELS